MVSCGLSLILDFSEAYKVNSGPKYKNGMFPHMVKFKEGPIQTLHRHR
jgi:hypothetical protein